jgi:hypothetical protein
MIGRQEPSGICFQLNFFAPSFPPFTSLENGLDELYNTGYRGQNENFLTDIAINFVLLPIIFSWFDIPQLSLLFLRQHFLWL